MIDVYLMQMPVWSLGYLLERKSKNITSNEVQYLASTSAFLRTVGCLHQQVHSSGLLGACINKCIPQDCWVLASTSAFLRTVGCLHQQVHSSGLLGACINKCIPQDCWVLGLNKCIPQDCWVLGLNKCIPQDCWVLGLNKS